MQTHQSTNAFSVAKTIIMCTIIPIGFSVFYVFV